jgi:FtsH-binding integral membrane protein
MSKPRQTVADYMVIALSPVLIMALVGSLCFFLIEVFYRGQMIGGVCWVMAWFVIGIVLVSRIAIETSTEHAMVFGLGLAAATSLYMYRTQSCWPWFGSAPINSCGTAL